MTQREMNFLVRASPGWDSAARATFPLNRYSSWYRKRPSFPQRSPEKSVAAYPESISFFCVDRVRPL